MDKNKEKQLKAQRRKKKIRSKILGNAKRPRLNVSKSNAGLYLQLIDDEKGKTLVSARSQDVKKKKDVNVSFETGKNLAVKAVGLKIKEAVFDRGGSKYHGRIKEAAEGAREGGLKF
ncbi:MAG: 50S ribosomal protein L18 [bacterium]